MSQQLLPPSIVGQVYGFEVLGFWESRVQGSGFRDRGVEV